MKCVSALAPMLAMIVVAHPLPAAAKGPSLSGQWTGAAKVTKCSKEVVAAEVLLWLHDGPYEPPGTEHIPGAIEIGDVSGSLEIDGKSGGVIVLRYDPASKTFKSDWRIRPPAVGGWVQSNISPYWATLTPADAWIGVGNYQSLAGTFSMPDSMCPALGDTGEVITVTLKRR
jgi:hypothetical protein